MPLLNKSPLPWREIWTRTTRNARQPLCYCSSHIIYGDTNWLAWSCSVKKPNQLPLVWYLALRYRVNQDADESLHQRHSTTVRLEHTWLRGDKSNTSQCITAENNLWSYLQSVNRLRQDKKDISTHEISSHLMIVKITNMPNLSPIISQSGLWFIQNRLCEDHYWNGFSCTYEQGHVWQLVSYEMVENWSMNGSTAKT